MEMACDHSNAAYLGPEGRIKAMAVIRVLTWSPGVSILSRKLGMAH